MTNVEINLDSLKVVYPVTHQPDGKEYQNHVTVRVDSFMKDVRFEVGSNVPGSYTVANSISTGAARTLAYWILANTDPGKKTQS